ncbi:hypothetical protein [Pseudomonas japonica]|uniref:Lipoprotein n=1 Tax=Pseudomonas japonica TaxID=256466 RepID=A0A239C018_9PSED|nr:hypothetical protein [Pseudomonas japonica]SNS13470.1 hypothetical protein SAMN05444352_103295 [Pseudomonas japonica]
MFRLALLATSLSLLTACAGIAHDTPEARQQLKRDLHLEDIVATSTMSYCVMALGGGASCKPTPGIGVLTADSLLMVDFSNGTYRTDALLTTKDVRCIAESDGHRFNVFTKRTSVMVFPYLEGTDMNAPFRKQAIALLLKNGQSYLTGTAGHFARDTGQDKYSVTSVIVNGNLMLIPVPTRIWELYSPCVTQNR